MPKPSRSRSDRRRPLISPSSSMTRTETRPSRIKTTAKTLVHRLITVPCLRQRNCDGRCSREREVRRGPGHRFPRISPTDDCGPSTGAPSRAPLPLDVPPRESVPLHRTHDAIVPLRTTDHLEVLVWLCVVGHGVPRSVQSWRCLVAERLRLQFLRNRGWPEPLPLPGGNGSRSRFSGRHSRCVGGGLSRQTGVQALGFRFAHDLVEGFS